MTKSIVLVLSPPLSLRSFQFFHKSKLTQLGSEQITPSISFPQTQLPPFLFPKPNPNPPPPTPIPNPKEQHLHHEIHSCHFPRCHRCCFQLG